MTTTKPDRASRGPFRGVTIVIAIIAILFAMVFYRQIIHRLWPTQQSSSVSIESPAGPSVKLAPGVNNALIVEPVVIRQLGIKTAATTLATLPIEMKLDGTLSLDPSHLEHVRCRFNGEVVEIGKVADGSRPLQFGDTVKSDQLLAIVWSQELGEKKSELVDALSQQHLDMATRERLTAVADSGAIPGRELKDIERAVEADRVAVSRAKRTLQTWRVSDTEIAEIEAEANRLIESPTGTASEVAQEWPRVEVRAARDGVILEQNVAVGDVISQSDKLFMVADLSRLRVIASAYEEDLAWLDALPPEHRKWSIVIPADPSVEPIQGVIGQIGKIIDPAQHTAIVLGWVPNNQGRLRAGQFITATIEFPPRGNEVLLPATAVIEQGGESFVFVAQEGADITQPTIFARRSVEVSRQVRGQVCIVIDPSNSESSPEVMGLQQGEQAVVSGAVELQQSLMELSADKL